MDWNKQGTLETLVKTLMLLQGKDINKEANHHILTQKRKFFYYFGQLQKINLSLVKMHLYNERQETVWFPQHSSLGDLLGIKLIIHPGIWAVVVHNQFDLRKNTAAILKVSCCVRNN